MDLRFRYWHTKEKRYYYSMDMVEFYEFFEQVAYGDPDASEQYIFVEDYKRTPIYVGDIIKWRDDSLYNKVTTSFKIVEPNIESWHEITKLSYSENLVVIGNIHEDMELYYRIKEQNK